MPTGASGRGYNAANAAANEARGLAERMIVCPGDETYAGTAITQPAHDARAACAALPLLANESASGVAESKGAAVDMSLPPSPSKGQSSIAARSRTSTLVSYKGMPIHPSARSLLLRAFIRMLLIGPQCVIADFCIVEEHVTLGCKCVLEPYVFIKRWTTMGERNQISAGTVLGTDPLDKNFTGQRSYLRIGNDNKIREHYTISRGTQPESVTAIGDSNYIMTSGHIAHNAVIGNHTVIASCALVAGYVEIGDRAFISGGVVVHQFSRIGTLAMIGGNTRVNADVPPYFLYSGFDVTPIGINAVGLRRAGVPDADVSELKRAYRLLYRSGLKLAEAADRIASECRSSHALHLVDFVRGSERGICRP